MNIKVKTITSWLAAAVFLFALAINVKVTLDDPFMLLSDEAVATTTSAGSGSGWVVEAGNKIGSTNDGSRPCYNQDGGTISYTAQEYEVKCETPGTDPCPDSMFQVISSTPCWKCGQDF